MAATLTDAELTILGLVAEQSRHGYELEKVIEERGIRNWTALGFSSIYYLLDKLAKRGFVEAVNPDRRTGKARIGKSRAVFRITELGRQECAAASLDAIGSLTPLHARVLVGLANSPGLPDAVLAESLARRAEELRARIAEVREARERQEPLVPAVAAIFDYSQAMLAADAAWTDSALTRMRRVAMDKYDVKRAHKDLYAPPAKDFVIVDVPEFQYIAIDGHGDPNTSAAYADAVEALYAVAYALKFASKTSLGRDFAVAPLEGLWRSADVNTFVTREKSAWEWTMMISQPPWITPATVEAAVGTAAAKKPLPALDQLRPMSLHEGRCVQILHVGSYDDETPTLARLHDEYLPANGLTFNGDHHEIYLSDARRTDPAKLKTVLRQPVRPR